MEVSVLKEQSPAGHGRDLREWLDRVRAIGELEEVSGADWNLEIGIISELNAKRANSKALLFDEIKGYPKGFRVVAGALLNAPRLAIAFGLDPGQDNNGLVQALRGQPRRWEVESAQYPPIEVSNKAAPIMQNIRNQANANVLEFPAPLWHPNDGGRYLGTGCCVITRDPETGQVNLGAYRVMIHDEKTLGLMISPGKQGSIHLQKYHAKGEACPVAVVFGEDPLLMMAAGLEVPMGISEYNYIGAIKRSAVRVTPSPLKNLPLPADGEIAVEGVVPPDEVREEGPFGEWTGYYASGERPQPVIRVEAVYHRNEPIILGSPPNRPPNDYSYWRAVVRSALLHDAVERAGVPDVRAVWTHEAGGARMFNVISITQRFAGHARMAGFVACQIREGAYAGRYVVVVDDDIDPSNTNDVIWALATRSNPAEDIDYIRRAWSTALDPMVRPGSEAMVNSRAVIDACRPYEWKHEFPAVAESSPELQAQVLQKWSRLFR
ncbi:MAG: UbiD family decarboxylase [Deltaproteobacteria bacterium]|nr:UbiD family decarboxylase [Deltaproteobacteria bacterium]